MSGRRPTAAHADAKTPAASAKSRTDDAKSPAKPAGNPAAELYTLHRLTIALPGAALFAGLAASIPGLSRHQARLAIAAGLVRVDGAPAMMPMATLGEKAAVEVDLRHGIRKAVLARKHQEPAPTERPFNILYEDEQIVVVDKTAGVVSAPMEKGERGHVPELLRRAWRKREREVRFLGVVHRLDKETSGCLVFALTRDAQRQLAAQFASHAAGRQYRCLVGGVPRRDHDTIRGRIAHGMYGRRVLLKDDQAGLIPDKEGDAENDGRPDRRRPGRGRLHQRQADDDGQSDGGDRRGGRRDARANRHYTMHHRPARAELDADDDMDDEDMDGEEAEDNDVDRDGGRGKSAVTHFKTVRRYARAAELEVQLETGRTHQIRVSLAAIGCPVLGDRVYGFRGDDRRLRPGEEPLPTPPRMLLHAERLELDHPATGQRMVFTAPVPTVFAEYAQVLAADQAPAPRPRPPGKGQAKRR